MADASTFAADYSSSDRLHRRRHWSRIVAPLGVLGFWGIVLWGFWPIYYSQVYAKDRHWIIHIHAAVFTGWMLFLAIQVLLVMAARRHVHRRFGRYGRLLGIAVLLSGVIVAFAAPVMHIRAGQWTLSRAGLSLMYSLSDMLFFSVFFVAAMTWREDRVAHRYSVFAATAVLVSAAAGRTPLVVSSWYLVVWLLPLLLMLLADFIAGRRRSVAPWLCLGLLLIVHNRGPVIESGPIQELGRLLIGYLV